MSALVVTRTRRIDPSLSSLDAAHATNGGWTPSSAQVRPSPATKARKASVMAAVLENYSTPADYVLNLLFESIWPIAQQDTAHTAHTGKLSVTSRAAASAAASAAAAASPPRLVRNEFPYDVHPDTRHYILWYAVAERPHSLGDADISATIDRLLSAIAVNGQFEAVWYENPNMTVPGVFHVQVFWRPKAANVGESMTTTVIAATTPTATAIAAAAIAVAIAAATNPTRTASGCSISGAALRHQSAVGVRVPCRVGGPLHR